jgi:hypothetical protein
MEMTKSVIKNHIRKLSSIAIASIIAGVLISCILIVTVIWVIRRIKSKGPLIAQTRNKNFNQTNGNVYGPSCSTSNLYDHHHFSKLHSNSIPFIPVTVSQQTKLYNTKQMQQSSPKISLVRPHMMAAAQYGNKPPNQ